MTDMTPPTTTQRPDDPASWWRHPCEVTDRLYVSGDLPNSQDGFDRVLGAWRAIGITHVVDLRGEWNDAVAVAAAAPEINYLHLGTHDDGSAHGQEKEWFSQGVDAITEALADPASRVMVHCHMGVNRAPSMAYAVLLDLGHGIEEGLKAIRNARPIAAIAYARDAIRWRADRRSWSNDEERDAVFRVDTWLEQNPVDLGWIINKIRVAERHSRRDEDLTGVDDVDWDAELADLPTSEILAEAAQDRAQNQAREAVRQWAELRVADLAGFDQLPEDVRPDPDDQIGQIVIEGIADGLCRLLEVDYTALGGTTAGRLSEQIEDCLVQGVHIGFAAMASDQVTGGAIDGSVDGEAT